MKQQNLPKYKLKYLQLKFRNEIFNNIITIGQSHRKISLFLFVKKVLLLYRLLFAKVTFFTI
jgi:hypothetical protein